MYNVTLEKVFRPFKCNTLKRLGKNNDGGYLVNLEDVYATDLLLSFGLGSDISFEKDFTHLNDCSVIQQAVGYIRGVCNVVPLVKPNAFAASYAADRLKEVLAA